MSECLANELTQETLASFTSLCESVTVKNRSQQSCTNDSLNASTISSSSLPKLDSSQIPSILHPRTSSNAPKRINKRVNFTNVELYHFDRVQGFICVPSQGGSTLGMASKHWVKENVSVADHQRQRRNQRNAALLRFCLEGKLLLSLQQFRILERRVKAGNSTLVETPTPTSINSEECVQESKEFNSAKNVESFDNTNDNKPALDYVDGCLKRCYREFNVCPGSPEYTYPGESDEDSHFLDSLEEYYFSQPLPVKKRRMMLRRAGLQRIDGNEKLDCQAVRISRTQCGCTCSPGFCDPLTCQCAVNGISCQVDRASFPCACVSPTHCQNANGRIEFNPVRVKAHYLHTRMRLELERQREIEKGEEEENIFIARKRARILPNDESSSSQSTSSSVNDSGTTDTEVSDDTFDVLNTTLQGGCRDCQNDRYVRVLMEELANHDQHQKQQQEYQLQLKLQRQEEEEAAHEALLFHGNMDFDQAAGVCCTLAPSSSVDSGRSSTRSLEDYVEQQQESNNSHLCVVDEASDDALSPDVDDDEDEEDEDEEPICDEDMQVPIIESSPEDHKSIATTTPSRHLCRLEPISSLFHNTAYHPSSPHLSDNSSSAYLSQNDSESVTTSISEASTSRPPSASASPSLCEVTFG